MTDDIVTQLNTEEMTKAFYKAFPTVVTLEDAMRQALKAADEIERLGELLFQEIYNGQEKLDEIELLRNDLEETRIEYQKLWQKYARVIK